MKKLVVPIGTLTLAFFLAGCGSESRDTYINQTLNCISRATAKVTSLKEKIAKAMEKENPTEKDLEEAVQAVEGLREFSQQLQEIKVNTDKIKDAITKEEQEDYANRYRGKLESALVALDKEQKALDAELVKAEPKNQEAVQDLLRKIRAVQAEYEGVAKPR